MVTIRKKTGYILPESVSITGEVQYPGPYTLSTNNERVSDLLRRAGGYVKRYKTGAEKQNAEDVVKKIQQNAKDSTQNLLGEVTRDYDRIPLDLNSIAVYPGGEEDIVLKSRDEIVVPKFDGQVKISGAVLLATQVPFSKTNNLKDYIDEAGGFSGNAWRKKAYVVYANGKAATTFSFLVF